MSGVSCGREVITDAGKAFVKGQTARVYGGESSVAGRRSMASSRGLMASDIEDDSPMTR